MAARLTVLATLTLLFACALAVFWDIVPPVRGYLNPAPPANLTVSKVRLVPLRQTQTYTAPTDGLALHKFKFLGHTRRWYAHVPHTDMPVRGAVVLLHGSGRNGAAMIDMWRAAADQYGLVLIAPDAREPEGWSKIKDGGRFIRRVAGHAQDELGLETDHWFLFGHSAGAVHAVTLMQSGSVAWEAVAVHGGGPSPDGVGPTTAAVPYRSYIGDADPVFRLTYIADGAAAIAAAGHPTDLVIMQDHGHWFYDVGPLVANDAASWFTASIISPSLRHRSTFSRSTEGKAANK